MTRLLPICSAALLLCACVPAARAQFNPGPYGITPFSIAGPFVLPTLDGDWDFQANWNDRDCYIFIQYARGHSYGEPLWRSSKRDLFKNSPDNIHYFFLSFDQNATNARADVEAMRQSVDSTLMTAVFTQAERDHWHAYCHYVPTPAWSLSGWVGDVLRNTGYFVFAIDRLQRMRSLGLLSYVATPTPPPELFFVGSEAQGYDYEWDLDRQLQNDGAVVVPVFVEADQAGTRYSGAVQLPDAATMQTFDRMEFEMTFGCKYHADNNCFEWDYLANLYLCDDADSTQCGTEIGRWITAYRREGKWVSDATPFLAYLRSGGTKRFRFVTSDRWIVSMNIRLFRTGSGLTATEVIPLWTGGQFNLTYNPSKLPVTVSIDPTVKKAQLVALISGHGFGADVENCCEFCNHTHHFFVNGREYVKSYPEAGTQLGCLQQVPDGVSPDQYGTWYFGRGGWCPGYVVRPFIVDVTDALAQGENTLTYKALYRGQEYNPVPAPGGGTFWGRIDLSSYLVLWRSAQTSASGAQEPDAIDLAQNYPNPFRAATNISYTLPAAQRATVAVYDMLGRRVAVPFDGLDTPGTHDVQFRRGDLPPGLYLYRLSAGGTTRSKTMSVVD